MPHPHCHCVHSDVRKAYSSEDTTTPVKMTGNKTCDQTLPTWCVYCRRPAAIFLCIDAYCVTKTGIPWFKINGLNEDARWDQPTPAMNVSAEPEIITAHVPQETDMKFQTVVSVLQIRKLKFRIETVQGQDPFKFRFYSFQNMNDDRSHFGGLHVYFRCRSISEKHRLSVISWLVAVYTKACSKWKKLRIENRTYAIRISFLYDICI